MKRRFRFTLVELLVVIAIIMILAGLLFPVIRGARLQAKKVRAKTQIKALHLAIEQYRSTYVVLPLAPNVSGDYYVNSGAATNPHTGYTDLLDYLTGNNPRKIMFLDGVTSSGEFKDPWGNDLQVALDTDYNQVIHTAQAVGFQSDVNATVLIWSKGPDKQQDTSNPGADLNGDNIYSIETDWVKGVGHKPK